MSVVTETTATEPPPGTAISQTLLDNAANRRLCAGAYVDREFRDSVLRKVYSDRSRRGAPSYGFNVVLGLRHAWRAWWLGTSQHLLVLALLVIACVKMPLDAVIVVGVVVIWYVLRVMRSWAREMVHFYSGRSKVFSDQQ